MKAIRIADDVRDVLARSVVEGNILRLTGQFDRDLYNRTNKALEALGGKWNRYKKGHVFDGDPRAAVEAWKRTLEPSAGNGDLFAPLVDWLGAPLTDELVLFDKDPRRCDALQRKGYAPHLSMVNFLTLDPIAFRPFDRILMNPPFERGKDEQHIAHALNFLAPGGRLVAIASGAFGTRTAKASRAARAQIDAWGGAIDGLPDGSFKHAGTNVATVMVVVDKPAVAA